MPDVNNPYAAGFFFANEPGVNLKMREKIALAQMMQKNAAPKNIGEGIYSIGDSISDAIMARQLMQQDKDAQLSAAKLGAPADPGAITPMASEGSSPPPQTAGGQDPMSQAPIQPSVQDGGPPTAPGPMFRPNLRTETVMPPAAPAVPAPPDVPGATRMSTPEQIADFRGQNPLPRGLPPVPQAGSMPPPGAPPPGEPPPAAPPPARPSVADFGQKPVLAPTPPPVMAQGPDPASSEDPRRAIGLALLKQQMGGQGRPQPSVSAPAPAPAPAPPPAVPDQGIKPAPPPPLQRPYVPPEVALPQNAPIEAPTRREMELRAVLNANQGNPYAAQSPAATELKQLEEARAKRQTYTDERFKAQVSQAAEQNKLRQQGLMDQDKRGVDVEHIRAQINAGKIIQMEGRAFRVQDDGSLKDITPGQTGEGPPQIKMTQDQSDTLKFYKMGKTGASQLEGKEKILAEGWASELAGKVPFAGNKLMNSQYRAAKNAAGLIVQADLRDTSGATIGTQEYKDRFALLMPLSGDDALAMKNKAEARNAVLEGQRLALGTARPMADYVDKEHAKERAEKVTKLNTEMADKDRNKVYEKNGVHRKFNGSFWEEY